MVWGKVWGKLHCSDCFLEVLRILGHLIVKEYPAPQAKSISFTALCSLVPRVLILSWGSPVPLQWKWWVQDLLNGGHFLAVHYERQQSRCLVRHRLRMFSSWCHSCSAPHYFIPFLCPLLLLVQRRWDGSSRIFNLSFGDTAAMLTCLSSGLQFSPCPHFVFPTTYMYEELPLEFALFYVCINC